MNKLVVLCTLCMTVVDSVGIDLVDPVVGSVYLDACVSAHNVFYHAEIEGTIITQYGIIEGVGSFIPCHI